MRCRPVTSQEYVAYSHTGRIIPAIWFRYDLSPITVKYTERRQPVYRFITTVSALHGGSEVSVSHRHALGSLFWCTADEGRLSSP